MARPSMPAWLLKVASFSVTAMVLIGSTGYVSAHPQNPLAPLRPPVSAALEPSDALEELLEIPIISPASTPSPTPKPTTTPRPTATPARTVGAGAAATRAPVAAVATPVPTVAPTPAPTRAPLVVIAPSVRATSKPALTTPHSS